MRLLMRLLELFEVRKLGPPYVSRDFNKVTILYRAQPANDNVVKSMSYTTMLLGFARDHAVHMANTEEEKYHVVKIFARTSDVYHAKNPGEFYYNGPAKEGRSVFQARPGDEFYGHDE